RPGGAAAAGGRRPVVVVPRRGPAGDVRRDHPDRVTTGAGLSFSTPGPHCLKIPSPSVDTLGMDTTLSLTDMLPRFMEATNLRHRVLAMNIANVNPPGYHRLDVDFEGSLLKQLSSGGGRPAEVRPRVAEGGG